MPLSLRDTLQLQEAHQNLSASSLTCPVCGNPAVLKDSRVVYGRYYGYLWTCKNYPECNTYVGCHRGTTNPLGTLANPNLRRARMRAHRVFDAVWKSGKLTRKQAYALLREKMCLTEQEAHIAKFTLAQCYTVYQLFKESPDGQTKLL